MTLEEAQTIYESLQQKQLALDITRGKPAPEQLDLSNEMLNIGADQLAHFEGVDIRNYGGIDGIPVAKELGERMMDVPASNVLVGGNASLTLMYHAVLAGWERGYAGQPSWQDQAHVEGAVKFLCPVPGYDRHFAITESFGIEMIAVPMRDNGPDMDEVERLIKSDPLIKGMWCVPKYSNPTGCIYSQSVVERLAHLHEIAAADFRIFYDNAYAVHDLESPAAELPSAWQITKANGGSELFLHFASTSKITLAGGGISFLGSGEENLATIRAHLAQVMIGPDKVNQARHAIFFAKEGSITEHMSAHASILKPKFDTVINKLESELSGGEYGEWQSAKGGYFVSYYTQEGLASKVVQLCADAGVKLTPAGAAYPYGKDPEDRHIRIAPSFPNRQEVEKAMEVFVAAVKLATLEKQRGHNSHDG